MGDLFNDLPAGRLAAAAIALVALVIGGYLYLHGSGPFPGEAWLADGIRAHFPSRALLGADLLSYLGDELVGLAIVVLLVAAAWEESGRAAAVLVGAAAGAVLLAKLLKALFGPTQLVAPGLIANYPSGTTTFVTSLFGTVGWLLWRSRHRVGAAACALLVVGTGIAVIAVGEHYPSDVLAGWGTGGAWAFGVLAAGSRLTVRRT
jgi:undecaprenyl-diphosphatase